MARLSRISSVGVLVHVYQRGNNNHHQAVLADESNFETCLV